MCFITLCISFTCSLSCHLQIATIVPASLSRMYAIKKIAPAIDLAIDLVNNTELLPSCIFSVHYADSKCNAKDGPIAAFNFYVEKKVTVFFGPVCDYSLAPVARYSSHWNIPIITAGGFAHDFTIYKTPPNAEFPLLTRISQLSYYSLSHMVGKTLIEFNWKKTILVYDSLAKSHINTRFCYLFMNALSRHLKEDKIDYDFAIFPTQENLDPAIAEQMLLEHIANENAGMTTSLSIIITAVLFICSGCSSFAIKKSKPLVTHFFPCLGLVLVKLYFDINW